MVQSQTPTGGGAKKVRHIHRLLRALRGFAVNLISRGLDDPANQWLDWAVPLCAALVSAAAARVASGANLGAIIGGQLGVTILMPPLVLAVAPGRRQSYAAIGVIAGVLAVWWTTMDRWVFPAGQLFGVTICTLAWSINLAMLTVAAQRIGLGPVAPGCVIAIALAFFTWPIWLAAHISSAMAGRLAAVHPGLVANGLLTATFPWFEQPVAYRQLTVLNQSVPCTLPTSWIACSLVHGAIAAVIGLGLFVQSRVRRGAKRDRCPSCGTTARK